MNKKLTWLWFLSIIFLNACLSKQDEQNIVNIANKWLAQNNIQVITKLTRCISNTHVEFNSLYCYSMTTAGVIVKLGCDKNNCSIYPY